jgi:hypothetical protein
MQVIGSWPFCAVLLYGLSSDVAGQALTKQFHMTDIVNRLSVPQLFEMFHAQFLRRLRK